MIKKIVGYIFGFKESTQNGNSITVRTVSGMSDKFPRNHKHKRDFWCDEIREGDTCRIFVDPSVIIKAFDHELVEWAGCIPFQGRRYAFATDITEAQFSALFVFNQARLHESFMLGWESDDVFRDTLEKTVNRNGIFTGDLLEAFEAFQIAMGVVYKDQLAALV